MNYQEMKDYALLNALEYHLCDVDELVEDGKTPNEIVEMVRNDDPALIIWENFEDYPRTSLASEILSFARSNQLEYEYLLTEVNGEEWFNNWKEGK